MSIFVPINLLYRQGVNNQEKYRLSILIPVYNYVCTKLVDSLHRQAEASGLEYEIIVADDGSDNNAVKEANSSIGCLTHCRYISRSANTGRAAIRNFLAAQSRFEHLLFLDCDIRLPDGNFLQRYAQCGGGAVVYGGVRTVDKASSPGRGNIRYVYERAAEPHHTARERDKRPYKSFRTTNFLIRRDIMLDCPFDERFRHYGYEDVFFGKSLKHRGIAINHIDNPVLIADYEPNHVFVAKTEEALRTLHRFRNDLAGYSSMLERVGNMGRFMPMGIFRIWHRLFGKWELANLKGNRPRLFVFNIYRLGYYLSLNDSHEDKP